MTHETPTCKDRHPADAPTCKDNRETTGRKPDGRQETHVRIVHKGPYQDGVHRSGATRSPPVKTRLPSDGRPASLQGAGDRCHLQGLGGASA